MNDATPRSTTDLDALLATREPGHGMPRAFYQTDALYAREVQTIWHGGWLFAGFAFEVCQFAP